MLRNGNIAHIADNIIILSLFNISNKQYEPELFPGLIYRMVKPKIVLLIFVSGKIVLTGAKVTERDRLSTLDLYSIMTFLD